MSVSAVMAWWWSKNRGQWVTGMRNLPAPGSHQASRNPNNPGVYDGWSRNPGSQLREPMPSDSPGLTATPRGESAGGGSPPDSLRPAQTPDSCLGVKGSLVQIPPSRLFFERFFAVYSSVPGISRGRHPRTLSLFRPGRPSGAQRAAVPLPEVAERVWFRSARDRRIGLAPGRDSYQQGQRRQHRPVAPPPGTGLKRWTASVHDGAIARHRAETGRLLRPWRTSPSR